MRVQSLRDRIRDVTASSILDAAEQVAAAQGNASIAEIAREARVSVGTIYNHFEDRNELFKALFARRRCECFEAIDQMTKVNAREPFERQLRGFLSAVFEYFDSRRAFLRIAFDWDQKERFSKDDKNKPAAQQLQERAERIVRVGIKEKKLKEDGADGFAIVLTSIVRGYLITRLDDPRPFSAEVDRVMDLFLRGAAVR